MLEKLTEKRAIELLAVLAIHQLGGQREALSLFEDASEAFANGKALQRTKARIRELAQSPRLTVESDEVAELDSKVKQVLTHCR